MTNTYNTLAKDQIKNFMNNITNLTHDEKIEKINQEISKLRNYLEQPDNMFECIHLENKIKLLENEKTNIINHIGNQIS